MKTSFAIGLLSVAAAPCMLFAQSSSDREKEFQERAKAHFDQFYSRAKSHFEQMRGNYNDEYADVLDGVWKHYDVNEPTPRPLRPEPKQQPVAPEPDATPRKPLEIEPGKIVLPPIKIEPVPLNLPKDPTPTLPGADPSLDFDFFGTHCQIGRYSFDPVAYNARSMKLGDQWKKLQRNPDSKKLLDDCLRLREALSLCDVGYMWLCEAAAQKLFPADNDSQTFLTSYILNQSGYDVKLGLTPKGLTLLMATDLPLGDFYNMKINGRPYYIRNKQLSREPIITYDGMFAPQEAIPIRLVPDRMPNLDPERTQMTEYSSKSWLSEPEFTINVSRPEMEFFRDYPWMSWEHYIRAPLSDNFRNNILPTMRERVKGLSSFDGVRKLLSFVQYGFNYMTDDEQYNHEKINFPEENFYYPANDCEDRAILFATLVNEIYGLDVVLLHYPQHLSTAVDFRDPTIQGDAMNIDGHHYVMCDPTFIGARIGMTMPQYAGQKPEVHRR